jgi:hypothetical protein
MEKWLKTGLEYPSNSESDSALQTEFVEALEKPTGNPYKLMQHKDLFNLFRLAKAALERVK